LEQANSGDKHAKKGTTDVKDGRQADNQVWQFGFVGPMDITTKERRVEFQMGRLVIAAALEKKEAVIG
jgi:hypothetical protein